MIPKALGKFRPRTSESRRIPLEREISFRVPRFENFVTEYSANISATGIFVRTKEPLDPGTDLNLEFKVADDWKLIKGRGRVIWIRTREEGPDKPAGMGIRFLEMDPQSRRLIHWMVDKHAREGGETFEFDKLRQTADEALGEALAEEPLEMQPQGRGTGRSVAADRAALSRRLLAAVVAIGIGGLIIWLALRLTAPQAGGESPAAAPPPAAATLPAAEEDPPEVITAGTVSPSGGASALIDRWADSWSEGRVDEYLDCYSRSFVPPNGASLSQWRAGRAERLSNPRYIRVSITNLDMEVLGPAEVRANFFQNYRSDRFEDTVRKQLDLVLEDGNWKILREQVVDG